MNLFRSTKEHQKYWKDRKIDWKKEYQDNWDHPHRFVITEVLKTFKWLSIIEIGCGGGANLINIFKGIPGRHVGGVDISEDAITAAQKAFGGGLFKVGSADDIMMSDNSADVVLSDMTLIYVGGRDIGRYIKEMSRISRKYVMLCEFHSESWWERFKLKFNSGYNAYDWKTLLTKYGFYDIIKYKIEEKHWPGGDPQKTFAYIIVAKKITKR